MDEEKIDRRAHWIQIIATGLVAATVFCVTIKLTLTQLEDDFKQYKKDQKVTFKDMDNTVDDLTHRIIVLETKQGCSQ